MALISFREKLPYIFFLAFSFFYFYSSRMSYISFREKWPYISFRQQQQHI